MILLPSSRSHLIKCIPRQQIRHTSNRSSSSSQYLQRQAGDRFVKAKLSPSTSSSTSTSSSPDTSFVARSAFKLLHLQSKYNNKLIKRGQVVVDLGCSPGSWIQAIVAEMTKPNAKIKKGSSVGEGHIIGVDLLPLSTNVKNLNNVHFIQGNFLNPIIQARIVKLLRSIRGGGNSSGTSLSSQEVVKSVESQEEEEGITKIPPKQESWDHSIEQETEVDDSSSNEPKVIGRSRGRKGGGVDLILSDMLANLTGNPSRDSQLSLDLCQAALEFALIHLTPPSLSQEEVVGESGAVKGGKKVPIPASLIMKCLQSSLSDDFQKELLKHFHKVVWEKPPSSRPESREGFICCSGLRIKKVEDKKGKKVKQEEVQVEEEDSIYF